METNGIIDSKSALGFFIGKLKPFIDNYHKSYRRFPKWQDLDENRNFKDKFGTTGVRKWYYSNLLRRYSMQYLDTRTKSKTNKHYNRLIGEAIQQYYDAINEVSNIRAGRRIERVFSRDEAKDISSMILIDSPYNKGK